MHARTVCVELDGTLATYEHWHGDFHIGEPRPGAADFMRELVQREFHVVVFTTRTKCDDPGLNRPNDWTPDQAASFIRGWLSQHNIPFGDVYVGQGKPIATAYVDDRAVSIRTNPGPDDFAKALADVLKL